MTDKLTDKQKVLAVWPGAYCSLYRRGLYFVYKKRSYNVEDRIGEGATPQKAWAYAARLIEQQNTFVSCVKNGTAKIEDVNNWIDRWSASKDSRSLHEYLGMTEEQYKKWVDDDYYLTEIVKTKQ